MASILSILLASDEVRFVSDAKVYYRNLALIRKLHRKRQEKTHAAVALDEDAYEVFAVDGEQSRVRVACLQYLRSSLDCFFLECNDIMEEAEQLAGDLGGQQVLPHLGWNTHG